MGRGMNWNKARITTRRQKACYALTHHVDDVLKKERLLKRPSLEPKKWQETNRPVTEPASSHSSIRRAVPPAAD